MKMLEYAKMILEKVSFEPCLFEKELRKAVMRLYPSELQELKSWCFMEFSDRFLLILKECFKDVPEAETAAI
jgi:hypothetical protein